MADSAVTLDGSGISIKSFREIREALVEKFTEIFGSDIDLSPSSPDGQLLDLFAYSYSDVAEAIQGAAASLDVSSAEGTFLDSLGRLMGISRRDGETDEVYRSRMLSAEQTGLATYDGMLTYLRKEIGESVALSANDEPYADAEGIPGHSVAVYVPDSLASVTDDQIAQAIWDCKPAGIRTYGSSEGKATDISGKSHALRFTRIVATSAYFARITVTEYEEETLPTDYSERIAESVAEWAVDEFTPGKDIIPQRFVQAVYLVPGIDTVTVEVSADGKTGWTSDRISVPASKYASFPKTNISVSRS